MLHSRSSGFVYSYILKLIWYHIVTILPNLIYSQQFLTRGALPRMTAPADHFWKFERSVSSVYQILLSLTCFRFSLHSQIGLQCFPMNVYWLFGGLPYSQIPHLPCYYLLLLPTQMLITCMSLVDVGDSS